MNDSDSIKDMLMEVAKLVYEKGMVNALEGNLSCREGGLVYMTPSGVCKGYLKREMIAVFTESGELVDGSCKPTSESKTHLAAYRLRDDIKAAIHSHPPYATAYALANRPIETKAYPEAIVCFDRIPVVEYGTPSTDAMHAGFGKVIHSVDVFLLANHGVMAVGKDLYDAFFKTEAVESIAKVLAITESLGGEKPLPDSEIEALYGMRRRLFGKGRLAD